MTWPCCHECWTNGLQRVWGYGNCWHDDIMKQACYDSISDRMWWADFFADKEDTINAKKFFYKILVGCARMEHKSCVMAMLKVIQEEQFPDWADHGSLVFILGDLEMTHALQTKTNFVNNWYSGPSVAKMSIDVYRYIISHADDRRKQTNYIAQSSAQFANVDVFNYIVENEAQNLNEEECREVLPRCLAYACSHHGHKSTLCIQAAIDHDLCTKDDIASEFNECMANWQTYLTSEEKIGLGKNLAQLVENGYICGSEFCYSIDA